VTNYFLKLAFGIGLLLCCSTSRVAHGQQKESIALTPAQVDATVRPGATYTQEFTLSNMTRSRVRFRCSASDYWYDASDNNARLFGLAGTLPRSASPWLHFTPSELTAEPGTSVVVKAVITVPPQASGGYYTMPTFEAEADAPPAPRAASSALVFRLGGLLMLTTDGAVVYDVDVSGGTVTPPTASSALELKLEVNNRSTAHVCLRGIFAILESATGKVVARGQIEEKRFLPGQREALPASWAGRLAPGEYTVLVTLTHNRAGAEPAALAYELPLIVKPE
jgi:hypothetical protein